jgi:hypothetical protein
MRFKQDEWGILDTGTLTKIILGDLSINQQMLNPLLEPSSGLYYDHIADLMHEHRHKWEKLVKWVATSFGDMLDDKEIVSYSFLNTCVSIRLIPIQSIGTG